MVTESVFLKGYIDGIWYGRKGIHDVSDTVYRYCTKNAYSLEPMMQFISVIWISIRSVFIGSFCSSLIWFILFDVHIRDTFSVCLVLLCICSTLYHFIWKRILLKYFLYKSFFYMLLLWFRCLCLVMFEIQLNLPSR